MDKITQNTYYFQQKPNIFVLHLVERVQIFQSDKYSSTNCK